ncbi:MAG: hypothetical protein UR49_C0027G0007 [candidate division WS6 bacterium GW2011_GWF2_33_92]|nr:MAG: hypothetical protein UR49_C0027G0007 [candidate division WS6 bacterium GW2011_GWF2_33_92]
MVRGMVDLRFTIVISLLNILTLVLCLALHGFTTRSCSWLFIPIIIPSYTSSEDPTKSCPLSCIVVNANPNVVPVSCDMITPFLKSGSCFWYST